MATKDVYIQFGNKPANPVNQTDKCDTCTPTMKAGPLNDLAFDSATDARTAGTNQVTGNAILQTYVKQFWDDLWNAFKCTNKDCTNPDSCGNKPTYLEYGSVTAAFPVGAGLPPVILWQLYLIVAREIKCIKGTGQNLAPEIPKLPEPPKVPEVPEPPKSPDKPKAPSGPDIPRIIDEATSLLPQPLLVEECHLVFAKDIDPKR